MLEVPDKMEYYPDYEQELHTKLKGGKEVELFTARKFAEGWRVETMDYEAGQGFWLLLRRPLPPPSPVLSSPSGEK